MYLDKDIKLMYENEETKRVAEPFIESLPIRAKSGLAPSYREELTLRVNLYDEDTDMETGIALVNKSSDPVLYVDLERLNSDDYNIKFESNNGDLIIQNTKKEIEFLLGRGLGS